MTVTCQECPSDDQFEGDVKQLCSHIGKGHEITWKEYKSMYDVDTTELEQRNRRNARRGWRLKKKHS